jgi:hypothetical protein
MIMVHAGNRVDEPGRAPRFPPERERSVRERFDALLDLVAPEGVVTSAAAGADLLLVEAAMARSISVHLVLPFSPERFREESVADRGERWVRSYDDAVGAVSDDGRGSILVLDLQPDDEGFRAANGVLIEHACSLAPGRVLAVTVRPRCGGKTPSVTDDFVQRAETVGLFVVEIDPLSR